MVPWIWPNADVTYIYGVRVFYTCMVVCLFGSKVSVTTAIHEKEVNTVANGCMHLHSS